MTTLPTTTASVTAEWLTNALRSGGTIDATTTVATVEAKTIGDDLVGVYDRYHYSSIYSRKILRSRSPAAPSSKLPAASMTAPCA